MHDLSEKLQKIYPSIIVSDKEYKLYWTSNEKKDLILCTYQFKNLDSEENKIPNKIMQFFGIKESDMVGIQSSKKTHLITLFFNSRALSNSQIISKQFDSVPLISKKSFFSKFACCFTKESPEKKIASETKLSH